jgi:hypothetical protein
MGNLVNVADVVKSGFRGIEQRQKQYRSYDKQRQRVFSDELNHGAKLTNYTITQCLKTISILTVMTGS